MKLENDTITILKNFSTINRSLIINAGNKLSTMAPTKTVIASATLTQEFDKSFGIYDLSKFLSVVSLLKDPDLTFADDHVKICMDRQTIKYKYCEPSMITAPKTIKFPKPSVEFVLDQETFVSIQKAISVLSVEDIVFVGEDGKLRIEALDTKNSSSDSYSVEIGDAVSDFRAPFKFEYLKLIPRQYTVSLAYAGNTGIARFISDNLTYYIPMEATA